MATIEEMVLGFAKIPVDFINEFLTGIFPNFENFIVLLISFIIAYFIKRNEKKQIWFALLITFILYGFFRWLQIGG